jgi:hypothetical protein
MFPDQRSYTLCISFAHFIPYSAPYPRLFNQLSGSNRYRLLKHGTTHRSFEREYVFVCFVWFLLQTATVTLNSIDLLNFVPDTTVFPVRYELIYFNLEEIMSLKSYSS